LSFLWRGTQVAKGEVCKNRQYPQILGSVG